MLFVSIPAAYIRRSLRLSILRLIKKIKSLQQKNGIPLASISQVDSKTSDWKKFIPSPFTKSKLPGLTSDDQTNKSLLQNSRSNSPSNNLQSGKSTKPYKSPIMSTGGSLRLDQSNSDNSTKNPGTSKLKGSEKESSRVDC